MNFKLLYKYITLLVIINKYLSFLENFEKNSLSYLTDLQIWNLNCQNVWIS
jgi:hypothetical protein